MTTLIIILNTLFCFLSDATSVRKKMEWNVKPTLVTFLVCSSCINRSNNGRHSFPSLLVILCVNPHLALLHHLVKSWGFSFFSERERERENLHFLSPCFTLWPARSLFHSPLFLSPLSLSLQSERAVSFLSIHLLCYPLGDRGLQCLSQTRMVDLRFF